MSVATDTILDESVILGEIAHYVCCVDEDTALCGEDMSEANWISISAPCTPCVVNDERGHCPVIKGLCTWGKSKHGDDPVDE